MQLLNYNLILIFVVNQSITIMNNVGMDASCLLINVFSFIINDQ